MTDRAKESFIDLEQDLVREEALEEQLGREWEQQADAKRFEGEVLFCAQGLGSFRKVNTEAGQIEIYEKGDHCEVSLKDLCRFCKRDDMLIARLALGKWNVFQNDLLNLLLAYPQDKVLTYYIIILIESLTNTSIINNISRKQDKEILIQNLQQYKICFLKPKVFTTIMNHLAECVEGNQKTHQQVIELVVMLIRNLLSVPDEEELGLESKGNNALRCNLQRLFIETLLEQQVMAALNYISQDFSAPFKKKIAPVLIEIFYYVCTGFDPDWLLRDEQEERLIYAKALQKEQARQNRQAGRVPSRHSRFGGILMVERIFEKESFQLISNSMLEKSIDYNPHQRHKPVFRQISLKHQNIFVKPILFAEDPFQNKREDMRISTIDFMQHCFSRLIDSLQDEIARDSERIDPSDKINYFVLIAYFLKFNRTYCKKNIDKKVKKNDSELSHELVYVAAALQISQFELIYSNLLRETTKTKKGSFNYRNYYAAIVAMMEFLYVVRELSISVQAIDRKNAQILMQNIFSHDISRVLRIGFQYCTQGLFGDNMLKTLFETTSLFFDLLESYSRGKTLSIRTNKLLKKQIKIQQAKKVKIDDQLLEQEDENNNNNNNNYNNNNNNNNNNDNNDNNDQSGIDEDDEDDDEPIYRERKFNLMSEFAIVVEYGVVDKLFYLIQGELKFFSYQIFFFQYIRKILSNTAELNASIYKYLQRVIDLLQANWLFFQVSYLTIINSIINRKDIIIRSEHRNLITVLRKIARSFIQTLRHNQLLAIEALFKFPDAKTKDLIVNNYKEETDLAQINDQEEIAHEPTVNIWSKQEDEELINNYDRFRDSDNPYEQMSQYLASLGFIVKNPSEIRKRVKKYKLDKGTNYAMEEYQKQDQKWSLKREEQMLNSAKELLIKYGPTRLNEIAIEISVQLSKYIEYRGDALIDMPIPPQNNQQFDWFEDEDIKMLLLCLNLRKPQQGEVYWRLTNSVQISDIQKWLSDLQLIISQQSQPPVKMSDQKKSPMLEENTRTDEYDDIFD